MTDREILEKILSKQEQMGADITQMKKEMAQMQESQEQMQERQEQMQEKQEQMQGSITEIKLHLENEVDRGIRLLAENYGSVVDKLNAIPHVSKESLIDVRVTMLESRFRNVEKQVKQLQEKMA